MENVKNCVLMWFLGAEAGHFKSFAGFSRETSLAFTEAHAHVFGGRQVLIITVPPIVTCSERYGL